MYSRSFYPTDTPLPPENYVGTAFNNEKITENPDNEIKSEPEITKETEESVPAMGKEKGDSLFGLSGLSSLFGGSIFDRGLGFLSDIKTEEILIIAVAAFLLFSKDGDIECAILLILLLFIK